MDLDEVILNSVREQQEDVANAEPDTNQPVDAPESDEQPEVKVDPAEAGKDASSGQPEASNAPSQTDKDKAQEVVDDFAKKIGLPAESSPGRENRIPYSRVRKIVEKAEKDAIAKVTKELTDQHTPKYAELETKTKDYETRLEKVGRFEQILFNDPKQFLGMLENIPAYKEFFTFVRQAYATSAGLPLDPTKTAKNVDDDMPMPDKDGGYSIEQFRKALDWQSKKSRKEFEAELNQRFGPIEQQYRAQQQIQQVMPEIQAMVNEARTNWPLFTENEAAIIEVLRTDPKATLDAAYRRVVVPKLQSNTDSAREEARKAALEEVKRAATSTSVASRQTKSVKADDGEPRDLDDVIRDSIKHLKR